MCLVLSLMKWLMIFFNGLMFLAGISLLGLGIWLLVDPEFIWALFSNPYLNAGRYIIVVTGAVITVLAYLGCCGAITERSGKLILYFILLLLLLVLEVSTAAFIYAHGQKIRDNFLLSKMGEYYEGDNASDSFSRSWNLFMITFSCCGILGPADFAECHYFRANQPDDLWPHACCTRTTNEPTGIILDLQRCKQEEPEFLNQEGCYSKILKIFTREITITKGVAYGIIGVQLCGMLFACCLCSTYG